MLYRCYAKVNLTLEILGRRADGFHELRSLVHTINLADELRIEPHEVLLARVEGLDLAVDANLVVRAARALAGETSMRAGAELTLRKQIPAAAGLGGGSSDAATTLIGLNGLWRTRLGYTALEALAAQLGSDVPFFIRGGAALMQGRGDELRALPALQARWLVLVVSPHEVVEKTRRLYAALRGEDFSDGAATARAIAAVEQRDELRNEHLYNGFSRAACEIFPGLEELWQWLERHAGRKFHLSGAGPALFALAANKQDAEAVVRQLEGRADFVGAVRTVRHARAAARPRP